MIIQSPPRLLELASRLKITYTFSPNFLIANILREASTPSSSPPLNLSHLQAFISGGEAIPSPTAVAFANLLEGCGAPRNVLRAGFGMSETGAGCIYDKRPTPRFFEDTPRGSGYLSLGRCCRGVEIRITDPADGRMLPVGSAGNLQISGSSVFEGYYGNRMATVASFTADGWFITGDLARLDNEGNLHLVGREKDCININGVKYLPQDISRYIEDAKVPGVMYAFVYVCPMRVDGAATETYAVFYRHEIDLDKTLLPEQKRAVIVSSQTIKNLCTIFSSAPPHIVLPLPSDSFVKTSLGKMSQAQLVKAYLQGVYDDIISTFIEDNGGTGDSLDPSFPVEQAVSECVGHIFSFDSSKLRRSQNIFDLGASSMHLLRLKQALQERLSIPVMATIEILKRPNVGELCDYLTQLVGRNDDNRIDYQPLVCFNSVGSKPPLFLIHPGVGEVLVFVNLARILADDRPVYALRARGFDYNDSPFETFDEMVKCYSDAIERCHPSGPYYIAGYSFGGAAAFEIGKILESRGKRIAFLGILNLPPHISERMHELSWSEVLINLCVFLSLFSASSMDTLREALSLEFPDSISSDKIPTNTTDPIKFLFERGDQLRLAELDLRLDAFTRWVEVAYAINRTGRTYEPRGRVSQALTTVFCAVPLPSMGTREQYRDHRLKKWQNFSGDRFEMVDVDGEHYTVLSEKHVASFAVHLRGALARADM